MTDDKWQDVLRDIDDIMQDQARKNRYLARVQDYLQRGLTRMPLLRVGITGGVASGKSSVAHCFEQLSCPVVSADAIVHDLLSRDTAVRESICQFFSDILVDGAIDRQKLGAVIFQDADKRKQLEQILHPRVGKIMQDLAEGLELAGHDIACFEIPLLFESGWQDWCDHVIVVTATEEEQVARAISKWGIGHDEALARIQAQMPLAEKIKQADTVIDNIGPLDALMPQVELLYRGLKSPS